MKKFLFICILFILSCSKQVIQVSYPEKFEGLTQLVLASQTTNVTFTEDVSKSLLAIFKSHAKVRVQSSVTYDFYLDFDTDGYDVRMSRKQKKLFFYAPPIRVKKPVIHESTVSYPETGFFVNEDKEAVRILETLTDRFISEGENLLLEDRIQDKCEEKLKIYLLGLSKEFSYDIESVEVEFQKE